MPNSPFSKKNNSPCNRSHAFFTDGYTGDVICSNCGLIREERIPDGSLHTPVARLKIQPGGAFARNPFSKVTHQKLHAAYCTNKFLSKKTPSIFQILDMISASEGFSLDFKSSVKATFSSYLALRPYPMKSKIIGLLLCIEYELKVRQILMPFSRFKHLYCTYAPTQIKPEGRKLLAHKNAQLKHIQQVLKWKPIALTYQAYVDYIFAGLPRASASPPNRAKLAGVCNELLGILRSDPRTLPITRLICVASIVNIASFIIGPYITHKTIGEITGINYANFTKKAKLVYGRLVHLVTKQHLMSENARHLVARQPYY